MGNNLDVFDKISIYFETNYINHAIGKLFCGGPWFQNSFLRFMFQFVPANPKYPRTISQSYVELFYGGVVNALESLENHFNLQESKKEDSSRLFQTFWKMFNTIVNGMEWLDASKQRDVHFLGDRFVDCQGVTLARNYLEVLD